MLLCLDVVIRNVCCFRHGIHIDLAYGAVLGRRIPYMFAFIFPLQITFMIVIIVNEYNICDWIHCTRKIWSIFKSFSLNLGFMPLRKWIIIRNMCYFKHGIRIHRTYWAVNASDTFVIIFATMDKIHDQIYCKQIGSKE